LIINTNQKIDIIIPVPVSKLKRKKRGFNQSEVIAIGVNKVLKKTLIKDYFERVNNLKSQIYSSRFERFLNVENQYYTSKNIVNNLNILIVDDVVTSGATINSCINAIKQKNINIYVAALAGKKDNY
jgi:ComF family protein